mmetsp:Transcript_15904/g.31895  ORF Transcript_15904/g.31895 Transcript_15904/m.31895 type:complete len:188 (-) Transcript_15904:3236-3799(-)
MPRVRPRSEGRNTHIRSHEQVDDTESSPTTTQVYGKAELTRRRRRRQILNGARPRQERSRWRERDLSRACSKNTAATITLDKEEDSEGDVSQPASHQPLPTPNDASEIEALFAGKRKKRQASEAAPSKSTDEGVHGRVKVTKLKRSTERTLRRYTEEGYPIYTEEELMADQPAGLDGPCPFDCACCF